MAKINRDKLNSVDPSALGRVAVAALDAIQHEHTELQPLALALAFKVLASHYNLPPQDLFVVVGNITADPDNAGHETLNALNAYAKGEWHD
jgi:hypothetical protein